MRGNCIKSGTSVLVNSSGWRFSLSMILFSMGMWLLGLVPVCLSAVNRALLRGCLFNEALHPLVIRN
ncbi:MAG: hypothetical protein LBB43_02720 [Spirochaetaceae bacterium]|nr:hypothetical protein [Spirochaetaceae bacterium]